jgi:periplasmic protein TonB
MPARRIMTFASVVIHAIAIAAIVIAQLLAVGPLPPPHRPLAFDDVTRVTVKDIDLPAPPRAPAAGASRTTVSRDAAPLVAPQGVQQETPRAGGETVAHGTNESAGTGVDAMTVGIHLEPPLPPAPPSAPAKPVRLSTGMQAPRKIHDAAPAYPAVARTARVEGVVILEAVIDAAGSVESVRVLRSIPLLDRAAIDAVRQWKFTPTLLNGAPVPIVMTVTVDFRLQ